MNYEKLIHNLDQLAEEKGITRNKILTESGVGKNFVTNIMGKTKSNPGIDKIQQLADYLGCSTDYLLGRTDDPQGISSNKDLDTAETTKSLSLSDEEQTVIAVMRLLNNDGIIEMLNYSHYLETQARFLKAFNTDASEA